MRKWKDELVPVLIEMMQDSTAPLKREVRYHRLIKPLLFYFLNILKYYSVYITDGCVL